MRGEHKYQPLSSDADDPILPDGYIPVSREEVNNATEPRHHDLPLSDANLLAKPLLADTQLARGTANRFPLFTPRHSCGKHRQTLRDSFNKNECDALILIDKYDSDKNGFLDAKELKALLTILNRGVYSQKATITDEDVQYFMLVADANLDGMIDESEVMLGIKVWFAYNHMPKQVNSILLKHGVCVGCPLPNIDVIDKILVQLNENISVQPAESVFVRQMALSMGATEQDASSEQLRRALAMWYLNVERSDTDALDLARHALAHSSMGVVRTISDRFQLAPPRQFNRGLDDPDDLESQRQNPASSHAEVPPQPQPPRSFPLIAAALSKFTAPDLVKVFCTVVCITFAAAVFVVARNLIPQDESTCEHDLHGLWLSLAVLAGLQVAVTCEELASNCYSACVMRSGQDHPMYTCCPRPKDLFCAAYSSCCRSQRFSMCRIVVTAVVFLIGSIWTLQSSSEKCGGLYTLSLTVFIVLPVVCVCTGCGCLATSAWLRHSSAEQRLREHAAQEEEVRQDYVKEISSKHSAAIEAIRKMPKGRQSLADVEARISGWRILLRLQHIRNMTWDRPWNESPELLGFESEMLSALFEKYDVNESNGIDRYELKQVLRDLLKALHEISKETLPNYRYSFGGSGWYYLIGTTVKYLYDMLIGSSDEDEEDTPLAILEQEDMSGGCRLGAHVYSATRLSGDPVIGFGEGRQAIEVRRQIARSEGFPLKRIQLLTDSGEEVRDDTELSSNVRVVFIAQKEIPDVVVNVYFAFFLARDGELELSKRSWYESEEVQSLFRDILGRGELRGADGVEEISKDVFMKNWDCIVQGNILKHMRKVLDDQSRATAKENLMQNYLEKFDEFAVPGDDETKVLSRESFQKLVEHFVDVVLTKGIELSGQLLSKHEKSPFFAAKTLPVVIDSVVPVLLQERSRMDLSGISTALELVFSYLDVNKDGVLERKEVESFVHRLFELLQRGRQPAHPQPDLANLVLDEFFSFVDKNGDGKISGNEALALIEALGQIIRFLLGLVIDVAVSLTQLSHLEDSLVEVISQSQLFKVLDHNSDGVISKAEFEKCLCDNGFSTKLSGGLEILLGSDGSFARCWNAAIGARMEIASAESSFMNKLLMQAVMWKDGGIDEATFLTHVAPLMEEHMAKQIDASWLDMDSIGAPDLPANMFWSIAPIPLDLIAMAKGMTQKAPRLHSRILESAKAGQSKLKEYIPEVSRQIFKLLDLDSSGIISHREVGVLKGIMDAFLRLGTIALVDSGAEISKVEKDQLQSLYPDLFDTGAPWPAPASEIQKLLLALFDIIDRDGDERLQKKELVLFAAKISRAILQVSRMNFLCGLESAIVLCKGLADDFWDYFRKYGVHSDLSGTGNRDVDAALHRAMMDLLQDSEDEDADNGITKEDFMFLFSDSRNLLALSQAFKAEDEEPEDEEEQHHTEWVKLPSVATWLIHR